MDIRTHLGIDRALCGTPEQLGDGRATVTLQTREDMSADDRGLVHGGFVFGAADYAAMLAVNDPFVVLGASECRFLAPVTCGQQVMLTAHRVETKGRKQIVEVEGSVRDAVVFRGVFTTFVLDAHVLDG